MARLLAWLTGILVIGGATAAPIMTDPPGPHERGARTMDGWLPYWSNGDGTGSGWTDVVLHAGRLDSVSFFAYSADPATGALTPPVKGMDEAALVSEVGALHTRETLATLTVTVFDNLHALLASNDAQKALIQNIDGVVNEFGFDGVDIDFEDFKDKDPGDTARFTSFIGRLCADMHGRSDYAMFPDTVSVTVLGRTTRGAFEFTDDSALIDAGVDRVRVMAYDDYYPGSEKAGACAPLPWDVDVTKYVDALGRPPWQFDLGIPGYAYRWPVRSTSDWTATGKGVSVTFSSASKLMLEHAAKPTWDDASQTPRFEYQDGADHWLAFYEDAQSWKAKVDDALMPSGMGGLSEWAIGYEDPMVWSMLDRELSTPYPIYGVIGDCYAREGGGARFGAPTTPVIPAGLPDKSTLNDRAGIEQDFEHGRIYYKWGAPRAFAVTGENLVFYVGLGGPDKYGFPTSDAIPLLDGEYGIRTPHGDFALGDK